MAHYSHILHTLLDLVACSHQTHVAFYSVFDPPLLANSIYDAQRTDAETAGDLAGELERSGIKNHTVGLKPSLSGSIQTHRRFFP